MHGPTQRNPQGIAYRSDGGFHVGSERAHRNPRNFSIYYRCSEQHFKDAHALMADHQYRARVDFFADALNLMTIMGDAASTFGYRDRLEFAARCIEALALSEQERDQR